jgi:hypothetical protein
MVGDGGLVRGFPMGEWRDCWFVERFTMGEWLGLVFCFLTPVAQLWDFVLINLNNMELYYLLLHLCTRLNDEHKANYHIILIR